MRFTNPRPDLRALEAFYSGDNYSCHTASGASSGGKKAEFLLDQIELACGGNGPKTMLDYGCGGGAFLKRALRCGWDARGFELGRRGRDECLKAGLNVAATVAELPDHQFRVITLHHVFEHIHDYRTALTDIRRLLSPGGVLFIEVPNASSLRAKLSLRILSRRLRFDERYRAFPIHLAYFDKRSLGTLLRRHGWIIRRSFTSGLGVEELIAREEEVVSPLCVESEEIKAVSNRSGITRALRRFIKFVILRPGLGENLCVFAEPE